WANAFSLAQKTCNNPAAISKMVKRTLPCSGIRKQHAIRLPFLSAMLGGRTFHKSTEQISDANDQRRPILTKQALASCGANDRLLFRVEMIESTAQIFLGE